MKKNTCKVLIIMTAMVFGLAGCSAEAKVERQLELGASSMEAGDYDKAIEAYEEVISLDKYEIEGYEGLVVAMAADGRSSEEIVGVVESATVAINELKESEDGLSEEDKAAAEDFYIKAIEVVDDEGTQVAIIDNAVVGLGEEGQLTDDFISKLENVLSNNVGSDNFETVLGYVEIFQMLLPGDVYELDIIMLKANSYIENEDWYELARFQESEAFLAFREKVQDESNYIYWFDREVMEAGIGFYIMDGCDCIQWYVGEYSDGMRSGYGGWYHIGYDEEERVFWDIYEGEWANDAPNGSGHMYCELQGFADVLDKDVTVVNGLLHGTFDVEMHFDDEVIYTSYEVINGKFVEVKFEDWQRPMEDGEYAYLIIERETSGCYWTAYKDELAGVAHFRTSEELEFYP